MLFKVSNKTYNSMEQQNYLYSPFLALPLLPQQAFILDEAQEDKNSMHNINNNSFFISFSF
tara:strand:- start:813 stop:995 length:183 start_codon:yes stop_codon:yes gene_type:complete